MGDKSKDVIRLVRNSNQLPNKEIHLVVVKAKYTVSNDNEILIDHSFDNIEVITREMVMDKTPSAEQLKSISLNVSSYNIRQQRYLTISGTLKPGDTGNINFQYMTTRDPDVEIEK